MMYFWWTLSVINVNLDDNISPIIICACWTQWDPSQPKLKAGMNTDLRIRLEPLPCVNQIDFFCRFIRFQWRWVYRISADCVYLVLFPSQTFTCYRYPNLYKTTCSSRGTLQHCKIIGGTNTHTHTHTCTCMCMQHTSSMYHTRPTGIHHTLTHAPLTTQMCMCPTQRQIQGAPPMRAPKHPDSFIFTY